MITKFYADKENRDPDREINSDSLNDIIEVIQQIFDERSLQGYISIFAENERHTIISTKIKNNISKQCIFETEIIFNRQLWQKYYDDARNPELE